MKAIDITGQRFGRLVAVERVADPKKLKTFWRMLCDCGKETTTQQGLLKARHTRSCGCLQREAVGKLRRTHGQSGRNRTPTYVSWLHMRDRCLNPRNTKFKNYGGRGIIICGLWDSYENFLSDMGEKPASNSLDRINNEGNYEPSNCRWATSLEQARNKRNTYRLPDGSPACVVAKQNNISVNVLSQRINKLGWSVIDACTRPMRRYIQPID